MPQLNKHAVNSSDFRVTEFEGVFNIQRRQIKTKTTGYFWWKREIEVTEWKFIDKYGNPIYSIDTRFGNFNNYKDKIKPFNDLESALKKIDSICVGFIYHYC